ncbi:MAG: DUF1295 domain-containing protein [bacterium]
MDKPAVVTTVAWLLAQALTTATACLLLLSPTVAGWVTSGLPWFPGHMVVPLRAVLLSASLGVLLLRMALTSLVLLPRRIEPAEALIVAIWLAVIHLGIALAGLGNPAPVGSVALIGGALFIAGSFINSFSELQRKRFKHRPENRGKLYRGGLFSLSMHINYFGDIVWAVGLAIMTGSVWSVSIPALMTLMFVFFHIPRLDAYLADKYGEAFKAYSRDTRKLIPWMY